MKLKCLFELRGISGWYAMVHSGDIHDRDGARMAFKDIRYRFPLLCHVFADEAVWIVELASPMIELSGLSILTLKVTLRSKSQACAMARS